MFSADREYCYIGTIHFKPSRELTLVVAEKEGPTWDDLSSSRISRFRFAHCTEQRIRVLLFCEELSAGIAPSLSADCTMDLFLLSWVSKWSQVVCDDCSPDLNGTNQRMKHAKELWCQAVSRCSAFSFETISYDTPTCPSRGHLRLLVNCLPGRRRKDISECGGRKIAQNSSNLVEKTSKEQYQVINTRK